MKTPRRYRDRMRDEGKSDEQQRREGAHNIRQRSRIQADGGRYQRQPQWHHRHTSLGHAIDRRITHRVKGQRRTTHSATF